MNQTIDTQGLITEINDTKNALQAYSGSLDEFLTEIDTSHAPLTEQQEDYLFELSLDNLDILHGLLNLHSSIVNAIGIAPHNTVQENLQNLLAAIKTQHFSHATIAIYALLKKMQLLDKSMCDSILEHAELLDELRKLLLKVWHGEKFMRILNKLKFTEQTEQVDWRTAHAEKTEHEHTEYERKRHKVHNHHQHLSHRIGELEVIFHHLKTLPNFEIILNHIGRLEGPISEFHMAELHGLTVFNKLEKHLPEINEKKEQHFEKHLERKVDELTHVTTHRLEQLHQDHEITHQAHQELTHQVELHVETHAEPDEYETRLEYLAHLARARPR